jgi:hypothetical protein
MKPNAWSQLPGNAVAERMDRKSDWARWQIEMFSLQDGSFPFVSDLDDHDRRGS